MMFDQPTEQQLHQTAAVAQDNPALPSPAKLFPGAGDTTISDDEIAIAEANAEAGNKDADPREDLSSGLFSDRENIDKTCRVLQQVTSAKNAQTFAKVRPPRWHLTFEYCATHAETLKKVASLLASLIAKKNPSTSFIETKKAQVIALLNSDKVLRGILQGIVPQTPSAAPPLGKRVPTGKTPATVPARGGVIKPPMPVQKPVKTLHNLNYNPEIAFDKAASKGIGVTEFARHANHIRIYIDEAWPGAQSSEYKHVGVISGIVWDGEQPVEHQLPFIHTHLREKNSPAHYHQAISQLLNCEHAFPFAFPIIQDAVRESDYPELLRVALIVLLGWILPQDGPQCDVKIYCEGIQFAQMAPGRNYACSLGEMRNTMGLTTGRMQRWYISEFVSLAATDKEFEYVPYADAVGYLTIPTTKAQEWGSTFAV